MVGGGVEGESLPIFSASLGLFCLLSKKISGDLLLVLLLLASSSRTW